VVSRMRLRAVPPSAKRYSEGSRERRAQERLSIEVREQILAMIYDAMGEGAERAHRASKEQLIRPVIELERTAGS
jgi:hypothetical protein